VQLLLAARPSPTVPRFIPYSLPGQSDDEAGADLARFRALMDTRRTVRHFSGRPVPRQLLEDALKVAGTAPSGAHKQPWTYVVVEDPALRRRIRDAAEEEERRFYGELAPAEWLRDLEPLGTDWHKAHLTDAPWLVVVFAQDYARLPDGGKGKHYYVNESVGISVGFFLAALRVAGLAALTHTPSPMKFLRDLLGRPANERAYVVIPVGHPAPDAQVPDLRRKELDEFTAWLA
jgi:iodotyrosine deiodinase